MLVFCLLATCFAIHSVRAAELPDGQIQPGVYPAPALPSNFTKSPQFWRSPAAAAPYFSPRELKSVWGRRIGKGASRKISARQSGQVWDGWQSVRYMFTLCVTMDRSSDAVLTLQQR